MQRSQVVSWLEAISNEQWVCRTCRHRPTSKTLSNTTFRPSKRRTHNATSQGSRSDSPSLGRSKAVQHPFASFLEAQQARRRTPANQTLHDPYGVLRSLKTQNAQRIYQSLERASSNTYYLQSLPLSTWNEIIRVVSPSRQKEQVPLSKWQTNSEAFVQVYNNRKNSKAKLNLLYNIIGIRRDVDLKLDLSGYRIMLRGAHSAGSAFAQGLWHDMAQDGVQPDVICYNYLLGSVVEEMLAGMKSSFIFTREGKPKQSFREPAETIPVIRGILQGMLDKHGIEPDAESYSALLATYCAGGHISAAKKLLAEIWGVDADAVASGAPAPNPYDFPPGDPLRPTSKLLLVISDTLGMRDMLPFAFQLVDFLSHHYALQPSRTVIETLFFWAQYHSHREGREWKQQYHGVPPSYLKIPQMYEMLQSKGAFHVSEPLHDIRLQNARGLYLQNLSHHLRSGKEMLLARVSNKRERKRALQRETVNRLGTVPSGSSFHDRYHSYKQAHREGKITALYMVRWVKDVLRTAAPASTPLTAEQQLASKEWQLRTVPQIVNRYRTFVSRLTKYLSHGGQAGLYLKPSEKPDLLRKASPALGRKVSSTFFDQTLLEGAKNELDVPREDENGAALPSEISTTGREIRDDMNSSHLSQLRTST